MCSLVRAGLFVHSWHLLAVREHNIFRLLGILLRLILVFLIEGYGIDVIG
jgi:hypothetical protein